MFSLISDGTVTSIAPIRKDVIRALTLPSIVSNCTSLKDIKNIFTGEGPAFVEKRLLTEFDLNQRLSDYEDYKSLILNWGNQDKEDQDLMPP